MIAVGYNDTTQVSVYSGKTLDFLYSPDTSGVNNFLGAVALFAEGRTLYAGGGYWTGSETLIRTWIANGRGKYRDLVGPRGVVMDIRALPHGRMIFGAEDPAWAVIDDLGNRIRFCPPPVADFRNMRTAFRLSHGGGRVAFGYEVNGKSPASFDVNGRLLTDGPADNTLLSPRTKAPGIVVTDWENSSFPKLNGKPIVLEDGERSASLAVSPDGRCFVLGTNRYLRCYGSSGSEIWKADAPGAGWAVNISGDGRLVVAAFTDGTIRWYQLKKSLKNRRELLALFPHNDRKRWVLWTPSGYYDASAGGEDLIGWHINNGKDKAADFFPISRFREQFYRPDVVAKVLETLDEQEAVKLADREAGRKARETAVDRMQPPVVTILSPQ